MAELFVVLFGAAVVVWGWRRLARQRVDSATEGYVLAGSGFSGGVDTTAPDLHHWPALGRFDFEVVGTDRHQALLYAALAELGPVCNATLHASREVGRPVEVRIAEQRVGHLSDGDATRFQRRLAYEGRPGQTSQCGARIVPVSEGSRQSVTLRLDLKPFRH